MSDERETPVSRAAPAAESSVNPGAPVEESEASHTEVLAAVERSKEQTEEEAGSKLASADSGNAPESEATGGGSDAPVVSGELDAAELTRREVLASIDTQLDLESPTARAVDSGHPETQSRISDIDDLPSAAGDPLDTPARDGEIRISADHPMAALYMQTPMPPEIRGNRGAGALIALVATLGFALVYVGALALWIAPSFPPSTFLSEGLLPWITSGVFMTAVGAFFVGMVLLVLIVGRAGWWAYVLGGFFVAALVWVAAIVALALFGAPNATPEEMLPGISLDIDGAQSIVARFGFSVPALAAAIVAREAAVWFGAWIGARGRRMKLRNAEALAEYEEAMAEVQAKQP